MIVLCKFSGLWLNLIVYIVAKFAGSVIKTPVSPSNFEPSGIAKCLALFQIARRDNSLVYWSSMLAI